MNDDPTKNDLRITRAVVGALRQRDLSGFEIWQWLGPVQGASAALDETTLYPTLYRLEAEGLLQSAWREDDRTRRTYRITAHGILEAEKRGWGAVAYRRSREDRTAAYPDPGGPEWAWRSDADNPQEARRRPRAEIEAIEAYLRELDGSLQLAGMHQRDVHNEIGDHLAASITRRQELGSQPADSVEEAIAALGPADELARRINVEQMSSNRLNDGLWWGSAVGMLTSFATAAVTLCLLLLATPVVAQLVVTTASLLEIHLFAPDVPEWGTEELAMCGWIGAFVGARRSIPHVAIRSRRSEAVVWPIWGAAGAAFLTFVVLIVPVRFDLFSALTLLGIPVAWVLGTRHPAPLNGEAITPRGAAIAAVIVVSLLLAPGGRMWVYDPTTTPPNGPSFESGVRVTVDLEGPASGLTAHVSLFIDSAPGWSDPRLEIWPAIESGIAVAPDPSAREPSATVENGGVVDLSLLSHDVPTWWMAVTAVDPDGQRHTIDSGVRLGWRIHPRSELLVWLLGRL